jgi:hypothetical protein
MNPSLAYQLYEAQHPRTRAQVIAADAERGRQAAAVSRAYRALTGRARGRAARAIAEFSTPAPSLQTERRCS